MTPGILIRPYVAEDIQPLYEAVMESRAQLGRWLPWCHAEYSIDDSRGWVQSQLEAMTIGVEYAFVISDGTGAFLGGCGLNRILRADRVANLGYWVRTSAAGRGVATAAVRLLVDWAFAETELERLEILAAVKNGASQRVALKAGAVREGVLRSRAVHDGVSYDCVVFSFVRRDFETRTAEGQMSP